MTYETLETSHQSGEPIELHTFARENVVIARYTSADTEQMVGGETYLVHPGGHARSAISVTGEKGRDILKITVAQDHPIAQLIVLRPRAGVLSYTMQRFHRADASDLIVQYAGRIVSARRGKTGERILVVEPYSAMQRRMGLSRIVQPACGHVLYGPLCRLKMEDWEHSTTVVSVAGRDLEVASTHQDWPYTGGIVAYTDGDGITDYAYVEKAVGAVFTLDLPLYGVGPSDAVMIYPGCDWTMATCHGVFSNAPNYGGRLHVPKLNPHTQSVFS